MIGLRDIPATYQRLVMAAPISNLSNILGLGTERNSIETLQRLVPILEVLNARLILIVEDTDRTGATFDTRHLERLLWALHDLPRTTFVLAFDPDHGPHTDFTKICDAVERLDALKDKDVAGVVSAAFNYWTSQYPDIEPKSRQASTLGLQFVEKGGIFEYIYRTHVGRPFRYMAQVLQTPRELKRVLQRSDIAWHRLHGEVDLEDLLIVTTLRERLPSVYDFLREHIDAARLGADKGALGSSSIEHDWDERLRTLDNPQSAKRLVALLGITQLTDRQRHARSDSPQGVHLSGPTDYLDRIHEEEIDPRGTSDQTVLRDISAWEQNRTESLVRKLAATERTERTYVALWEHFAFRHTHDGLSQLMVRLVHFLLRAESLKLTMDHPALLVLWKECHSQLPHGRDQEWIKRLIVDAVPHNLSFAVGLYDCLTGGNMAIVRPEERDEIRPILVNRIREAFPTDSALVRHLDGEDPFRILAVILKTATDKSTQPFKTWGKYLAPVLTKGASHYPEQFLPELATLLAMPASNERTSGQASADFTNPYRMDRAQAEALMGDLLDDVLVDLARYQGKNLYARRATKEAAQWLQERGDKAPTC